MIPPFLPYGRQTIESDDVEAVVAALGDELLTTGPRVAAFELAFAAAVDAPHATVCNSGTAALHLAALALGLGPGDTAVVASLTFLATANAVRYTGAEIAFADVDPETGLMRHEDVDAALARAGRAKAVFAVDLNGQAADIAALATHGLPVVEDACHALGVSRRVSGGAAPVGAAHDAALACFSLHPVKAIAMGEGGVVTTRDPALAERAARFRNHGMVRESERFENRDLAFAADGRPNPWYYEMPEPGWNYRAPDILCALGSSQLRKLDRFVARRQRLAALYDERLAGLAPLVRPVPRVAWSEHAFHLYAVLIDFAAAGVARAELVRRLRAAGIGTQVHYLPLHLQPYYRRRYGELSLPGAESYYARCLSLPMFPTMADSDVDRVAAALAKALAP